MCFARLTVWLGSLSIILGLISCDSSTSPEVSEPWIQVWSRSDANLRQFSYEGFTWDGHTDLNVLDESCRNVSISKEELSSVIVRSEAAMCGIANRRAFEIHHAGGTLVGVPEPPVSRVYGNDRQTGESTFVAIRLLGRVEFRR